MQTDIPLINGYKRDFLVRRLPQTALGGLKLKLGFCAPCYVYVLQLLLFFIPLFLAAIFTVLVEFQVLRYDYASYAIGGIMIIYALITNVISYVSRRKKATIIPLNDAKRSLYEEEEQVDFMSCCGVETIEFVIPGRKHLFNVIFHSLFAGPLYGLGFWYLCPTQILIPLCGNSTPAGVVVCILGWLSITIAQYSLTCAGPPEWATFRATDRLELNMLSRPFHCYCFFGIFVVARFFDVLLLTDQVMHGIFCVLPILWLFGWLPPMDAFILWGFEQAHVYLYGGSPMATDFWNVVYIVFTSLFFTIVLFIPHNIAALVASACFGYFLSTDLSNLCRNIALHVWPSKFKPTPQEEQIETMGFFWTYGPLEFCLIYFLLLLVGALTAIVNVFIVGAEKTSVSSYLGYVVIALWVILLICSEIQKVTVLTGMFRNKLFPTSVQRTVLFLSTKKKFLAVGIIRRILLNFVAPFVMVAYMSMEVDWSGKELPWEFNHNNTVRFWDVMAVSRGYRWIFQSTPFALFEMSIGHIVRVSLPSDNTWMAIPLATQLLIIGIVRDRLSLLLNKFYFVFTVLVTNWIDNRQRRKSTRFTIILNLVFFPLVLLLIMISVAFAAPLLPLFTLPIFLLGYPRPVRSWPGTVGAAANVCEDTVYYEQCMPQLAKAFRMACANGSLGDCSPGRHYLVRWQDRLVWIQILERGYFYVKLSIKGLELQETSCHTTEATRIDDIIESVYERDSGYRCCTTALCNPYPLTVLRPYDAAIIKTYSDARNKLTGVIQSPDTLRSLGGEYFLKTLTWVVVGQVYWTHRHAEEGRAEFDYYDYYDNDSRASSSLSNRPPSALSRKSNKVAGVKEDNDGHNRQKATASLSKHGRPSSAFSTSSWAGNDKDSLLMVQVDTGNNKSSLLAAGTSSQSFAQMDFSQIGPKYGTKKTNFVAPSEMAESVDDLLDELNTFGTPSTADGNVNQHNNKPGIVVPSTGGLPIEDKLEEKKKKSSGNKKTEGGLHDFDVECKSTNSLRLTPPAHWREMPVEESKLKLRDFPSAWYKHIISFLKFKPVGGKNSQEIANDIASDEVLMKRFSQVVMGCFAAVNVSGFDGDYTSKGAKHVLKTYCGSIPNSSLGEWIEDNQDIYSLVIQAYRMAVKLTVDSEVIGPATSQEELHDYLDAYDRDWYIGCDGDRGWKSSVRSGKPHCFSLARDEIKDQYESRTLSLQDTPIYISSVNSEAVRAQWANLNMELLYMTNDDDERYSIQAHRSLLRNLTVQAADPPLGYPIYSSEPISVPTL